MKETEGKRGKNKKEREDDGFETILGYLKALSQKTDRKLAECECGGSRLYTSTRNWKAEALPHS